LHGLIDTSGGLGASASYGKKRTRWYPQITDFPRNEVIMCTPKKEVGNSGGIHVAVVSGVVTYILIVILLSVIEAYMGGLASDPPLVELFAILFIWYGAPAIPAVMVYRRLCRTSKK
jgi:hypothetical protein